MRKYSGALIVLESIRMRTIGRVLAAVLIVAWAAGAAAQNYPSRNVRIICGFAAGGSGDFVCRVLADA